MTDLLITLELADCTMACYRCNADIRAGAAYYRIASLTLIAPCCVQCFQNLQEEVER